MARKRSLQSFSWETLVLILLVLTLAFLVIFPLSQLIYGSFLSGIPGQPGIHFTLANLEALGQGFGLLKNSVEFGLIGGIGATAMGALLAFIIARTDVPFKSQLGFLTITPLFVSSLTLAIAWETLGDPRIGLINIMSRILFGTSLVNADSYIGMISVLIFFLTPFAFIMLLGPLQTIDPSVEDAARICGANTRRMFISVTLRLVTPSILSAFFLCFMFSIQIFSIPILLGTNIDYNNLASQIYYTATAAGQFQQATALSLLMLILSVIIMVFYIRFTSRRTQYATIGSGGTTSRVLRTGRWRHVLFAGVMIYNFVAMILPFIAIGIYSFLKYPTADLSTKLLTLSNYNQIFSDPITTLSIQNTILLGIAISTVSVFFISVVAYVIYRTKWRGRQAIDALATLPIAIPGIALSISLIWAYVHLQFIYGTLIVMLLGYLTAALPLALRIIGGSFVQAKPELEEASYVCGASKLKTLKNIELPLLKASIVPLWIFLFLFVFRELDVPILLYNPNTVVIPVVMWSYFFEGFLQVASALTLVQAVIILILLIVGSRIFKVSLTGGSIK